MGVPHDPLFPCYFGRGLFQPPLPRRKFRRHGEQEIDKQTELEEAAEAGVLSSSESVGGLRVDIDQAAIQLARQVTRFPLGTRFFSRGW